jgi:hypothetical protein
MLPSPARALGQGLLSLIALGSSASTTAAQWTRVQGGGPTESGVPFLLTDGSVLVHVPSSRAWWRLIPDEFGDYVNGSWTPAARLPAGYGPLYYASGVLADGRVVVTGGEYNFGNFVFSSQGAVYDPVADSWTAISPPPGWTGGIGDAPCAVLDDGRFFLGQPGTRKTAVLDPATLLWANLGTGKNDNNVEETWTLLPDGSVLCLDCIAHPATERFLPTLGTWISAGNTPVDLVDAGSLEVGAGVLMPDGRTFAIGGTGHTALYTPPVVLTDPGSWVAGPDFPLLGGNQLVAADAPACLLPSGNVLCAVSPGIFVTPTRFFEFDGTNLSLVATAMGSASTSCYETNMLMLPTGQVLYTNFSNIIQVYDTASGGPQDAWRPTISACPTRLLAGETYLVEGTQFNGLSQCSIYGDDSTNASNYPLVRLTSKTTGRVHYARTFDHSTMAVATGAAPVSTHFQLQGPMASGSYLLEVVANGIPSFPITVQVLGIRPASTPGVTVHKPL